MDDLTWDWEDNIVYIFGPMNLIPRDEVEELAGDSNGMRYAEWDVARLVLLTKNGDLSQCKNRRGICVLDIASKIFSSMFLRRLKIVMEEEGIDEISGFRANRGTIDDLFTISVGLQKSNEHNIETWVLFVDLLKAFDTLPRDALFAVLRRYGLLNDFVSIIIRIHKNSMIKVKICSVNSEIQSSIGVRQGSCEGPVLFLFIMQAALQTMKLPVPKPEF
jgi:hypothetical protein